MTPDFSRDFLHHSRVFMKAPAQACQGARALEKISSCRCALLHSAFCFLLLIAYGRPIRSFLRITDSVRNV